jgi:D-alanyl-D-alanine carboxypeptidase
VSTKYKPKNREECELRYGAIDHTDKVKPVWPNERKWMTTLILPTLTKKIINTATGKVWDKVYCNIDMAKPLVETIEFLHIKNLLNEIKSFDGCFNIRDVRGISGRQSLHSWGLAIDFNADDNALGCKPTWSRQFIFAMRLMGWEWGGDFGRCDGMHFSWIESE